MATYNIHSYTRDAKSRESLHGRALKSPRRGCSNDTSGRNSMRDTWNYFETIFRNRFGPGSSWIYISPRSALTWSDKQEFCQTSIRHVHSEQMTLTCASLLVRSPSLTTFSSVLSFTIVCLHSPSMRPTSSDASVSVDFADPSGPEISSRS